MSWRLIRPDPVDGGELPATEFVHPLPIAALILLAVNDHLLKGSGWLPGVITGKLSDFAGLFFFPLLFTACLDVMLHALNRVRGEARHDASLRMWKLWLAAAVTTAVFTGIKLSEQLAHWYGELILAMDLGDFFPAVRIVQDPTDLAALPMVLCAVWFGRTRLAEVPPARMAHLQYLMGRTREGEALLSRELADCRRVSRQGDRAFRALVEGLRDHMGRSGESSAASATRARAERALTAWRQTN